MYGISALFAIDFYKAGHPFMFPEGLEELYGNFTPRGDRHARVLPDFDHKILWTNFQPVLQGLLIDLWNETFFHIPKAEAVNEYRELMDEALGSGAPPTNLIADLWDMQYLPIVIKALPEGSRVPMRIPTYTVRSTFEQHAWVEQYLETQMSAETWKVMTTATEAFEYRRLFTRYALATGADLDFVLFQGHDFSMRGMSGIVDAMTSGAAHLMVFKGTDTVPSIRFLKKFYPDPAKPYVGGSIRATEHAVASCNIIKIAHELDNHGHWNGWTKADLSPRLDSPLMEMAETGFLKHCLVNKMPKGMFSYVSDTYDFWAVVGIIAPFLKEDIMRREPDQFGFPGKIVFRPDSGDPVKIVVGDNDAAPDSPEFKGAVEVLWETFGGTVTSKGFKTLDSHVGLIYGDSISLERASLILEGLAKKGFSSSNIVFGIGSYTYQFVTRDSFGTAIKATHARIDGEDHDLFKDPKTDDGVKKSARGFLCVKRDDSGEFVLRDCQTREQEDGGELKVVFRDGQLVNPWTLTEVRERVNEELRKVVPGL